MTFNEDSLYPDHACSNFSLSFTPALEYQLPASAGFSQSVFRGSSTNVFWIVKNELSATVGQIISGGVFVDFSFPLAAPYNICINVDQTIDIARLKSGLIYSFAILLEDGTIQALQMDSTTSVVMASSRPEQVCRQLSSTGTYFGVAVVPTFETENTRVSQAQYYVGAALYAIVVIFGLLQGIMLLLDWTHQVILLNKLAFIAVIVVNSIVRLVYVLLPADAFGTGLDSIQFIVFELPTFLFFSVFTAIVYLWGLVVLRTYYLGKRGLVATREHQMRRGILWVNVIMYLVFVLFIYLIAIVPTLQHNPPCFLGSLSTQNNKATYNIKLTYWIYQFIVSVVLSTGFLAAAAALLYYVNQVRINQKSLGVGSRRAEKQAVRLREIVAILFAAHTVVLSDAYPNLTPSLASLLS